MIEREPDDSIEARVAAAATPDERAALLGLDFREIVRADRRLRWQSNAVIGACSLIVVVPIMVLALWDVAVTDGGSLLWAALGAIVTVILFGAAYVLPALLMGVTKQRSEDWKRAFFLLTADLLSVGAAVLAVSFSERLDWLAGVLVGAIVVQRLGISVYLAVRSAFEKNHKNLVPLAKSLSESPRWLSFEHNTFDLLIASLALATLSSAGTVLLISVLPLAAFGVAIVQLLCGVVALRALARDQPRLWIGSQIIAGTLVFSTGVTAFVLSL